MHRSWARFLCLWAVQASATYAVVLKPIAAPWFRGDDAMNHLRLDPKGRFVAFTDAQKLGLRVLDTSDGKIYPVTQAQVGPSFVWSPDGFRLFYRELKKNGEGVQSEVKAFDTVLKSNVLIEAKPFVTGFLTFDPRDYRVQYLGESSIHSLKLTFPDERLAKWQMAHRSETGRWLVTQNGVLWLTQGGLSMKKLDDDSSPIESFSIYRDGTAIAWATEKGHIFLSHNGETPELLDEGRDPKWHPEKPLLLYAVARKVGSTVVDYDLKVSTVHGDGRILTTTPYTMERWPDWFPDGKKIVYTKTKTTDLFTLEFAP